MGRGRAKAKQVKVARQLKYNSGGTDLERLRAELGVEDNVDSDRDDEHDPYDELADRYADYAAVDDEDDGDDPPGSRR
ncbi:hypothetical protein Aph01nite_29710 [Acrocarpospora phusangensis]|uniref:DUF3073 domain-containing protein n=1 Tax=Acrocarpospora phusangensis TaxID=1070424 RepID=A0A919UK65_9ACTN|nr:DUF3073 domain-containing protein [Acrocarpospora phusangensis]GIH24661.1 hypothetical protein Aph01nite_29710 [Acrocarpospora phusangensis]